MSDIYWIPEIGRYYMMGRLTPLEDFKTLRAYPRAIYVTNAVLKDGCICAIQDSDGRTVLLQKDETKH